MDSLINLYYWLNATKAGAPCKVVDSKNMCQLDNWFVIILKQMNFLEFACHVILFGDPSE